MAIYVIGDVHGCYSSLKELVKKIDFNPKKDTLWFVGDIINRGPESLKCLKYVKKLGKSAKMVLGNHELHLLASYAGVKKYQSRSDTLQEILNHSDVSGLIDWLRHQPLMITDEKLKIAMVHAGIPPIWSIEKALQKSKEIEKVLQKDNWRKAMTEHFFGNEPANLQQAQTDWEKLRYSINCFTRMRYCRKDSSLEFKQKKHPSENKDKTLQPWFSWKNIKNTSHQIFFGHWSTLGVIDAYNIHSTDTGCLWGGELTAYCIETKQRITVQCNAREKIK